LIGTKHSTIESDVKLMVKLCESQQRHGPIKVYPESSLNTASNNSSNWKSRLYLRSDVRVFITGNKVVRFVRVSGLLSGYYLDYEV